MTADLEPVVVTGKGATEEELLTPPVSPRPDHFGSLTSPVSPANSLTSPQPEESARTKPKRRNKPVPFLFRFLKRKKRSKKVVAAEAAGLAPPTLDESANADGPSTPVDENVEDTTKQPVEQTAENEPEEMYDVLGGDEVPEPEEKPKISWLRNKSIAKKKKKSGIFKLGRGGKVSYNMNAKQPQKIVAIAISLRGSHAFSLPLQKEKSQDKNNTPPRGEWTKEEEEEPSPAPKKSFLRRNKKKADTNETKARKGEKIDNILVEETYVAPDVTSSSRALSPKPDEDSPAALQRKAIMKDSWEFYRLICGLVCDRDRYNAAFQELQNDPVYPYLNSLMSVNDPGYIETENFDKAVTQKKEESYASMTQADIAKALEEKAKATLPEFLEICKSIAGALGVEELGIGPIKEPAWAIRKAQRKYDGDVLKVTDYCRVLLIVDDLAALLGLLELVRDSYGDQIRRVKLSTLKHAQKPKVGGYRDCIINMEVNDHICELQVHLRPLWNICEANGYKHYVNCMEYKTDSFKDPYASLKGLDRKSLRELIALADEQTSPFPLDDVKPDQEKVIMDYFALAGLYYKVGSYSFGEIHFSRLLELRKKSFGPLHPQATFLNRYLVSCLAKQGKKKEAEEIESAFAQEKADAQKAKKEEASSTTMAKPTQNTNEVEEKGKPDGSGPTPAIEANASFWDSLSDSIQRGTDSAYDLILDPNRKVREQEESAKAKVKNSKQIWRAIRRERYPFLEGAMDELEQEEEKATEEDKATRDVDDDSAFADAEAKPAPAEEPQSMNVESENPNTEEVVAAEATETTASNNTTESPKEVPQMDKEPTDYVEEKKEDGDVDMIEYGEKGETNPKETVAEEEEEESRSALDRLMENACSLCSANTTTGS
jgi:hypothetical protein